MEEIRFDSERRKGEQQARFGQGASQMLGAAGEFHRQLTRKHRTPNELAAWKLNQALSKYPIFTSEERQNLQSEFVEMPSLRTMNMKVLAATLSYLKAINNKPSVDTFKDEIILPHLTLLLPITQSEEDEDVIRRLIIRFKAQILIYIQAIEIFRSED
jgi:hypothetical protein